ncbi:uncharacterized protein PHACADRAFT_261243 [Phanerochaete carnosa HHB-10118-sp]|uniref:Uncharacterized protein n=1 Tax=Phanerochaete carnosa (strain HHB-10118-sp) TaxID=650164 RepID=K5WQM5_PHACS|nr:uncharacterized protein PHACADRAFT_261243 [Phanerochaete carnosa HHB-10118-sp]EKM52662.1 hypothetical protein PHACADRAFT_261243 [Phanerochaete carnosa HHB-10118-sp]
MATPTTCDVLPSAAMIASSASFTESECVYQREDILPGKLVTTPLRTAGPSLEQIVARVTAKKRQTLRNVENTACGPDGALNYTPKDYLLASGRSGLGGVRGASQIFS